MNLKRSVLTSALRAIGGPTLRSLRSAATRSEAAQAETLQRIVARNADTEFGRRHGFAAVRSPGDYRERVPIRDYEELRPFVEEIVSGTPGVLTEDSPLFLARTSGTTGQPKLIPVTKRFVTRQKRLTRAWMAAASSVHPDLLDHRALGIVSPAIDTITESGLPVGSTSGMIYRTTPAVLRRRYAVPEPVFSVADYDARYFLIARFATAHRLSVIATPNPATLLCLTDVMNQQAEQLISAIADGSLGADVESDVLGLADAGRRLRPDLSRARELDRLISQTGELRPDHVWPDLALIGCWLGGTSGLLAQRLTERFGDRPFRDLGYLASEGHFSVPLQGGSPGGLLDLESTYFEFLPEEADRSDTSTLGAHQLEIGERYRVIVTTSAGLYRYDMNDLVDVVGRLGDSPLIAFARKAGEMSNLTGEKLHANHVIDALEALWPMVPLVGAQFVADIDEMRYELRIEPDCDGEVAIADVARAFDEELSRLNVEYGEKRSSRRLAPVVVEVKPHGWSEKTRRMQVAPGASDAQVKWRYLIGPQDTSPGRRGVDST